MDKPNRKTLITVSLFVVGIMILGLGVAVFSDIPKLLGIFDHIHLEPLLFALLCTGLAYLAYTLSFHGLFEMTPYRVPFNHFFSIMFISYTINFVISSGGMSSIAIRSFLLKHHKVPYSVTIPLSFAQNMVFNMVLSCVCFGGLYYLRQNPEFTGGPKQFLVVLFMAGLLLVVAGMVMVFFNRAFRRWLFRRVIGLTHFINTRLLKKKSDARRIIKILNNFESTVKFLHKGWLQLFIVFFWCSMDWAFTASTLYFCFKAVGVDLPIGLLLVGFTVMFLSSNINPVPSGLGVSETLLAGTYNFLGVGFEISLVAALLFRVIFFLLPLAVSTALYLDTMRSFLKSHPKDI